MKTNSPELPDWKVFLDEISAGAYRIKLEHEISGANFEMTGADPDELIRRAIEYSIEIDLGRRNRQDGLET